MELLSSGSGILLAVLGIGFVIAIHELGHFLFAKWAGVRVLEFAIGFGPSLWTKKAGDTEYSLRLIPAGGYVAMAEQPDGSGRSFAEASAGWKALILLGGVLFNVISSYLLLLTLAWTGMPMVPPKVGAVQALITDAEGNLIDSPASEMGLQVGDHILSVNGDPVRSFEQLSAQIVVSGGAPVTLVVDRGGDQITLPAEGEVRAVTSTQQGMPTLGIGAPTSRRVAGLAGADNSELQIGDRIMAIDGQAVDGLIGQQLDDALLPHFGEPVSMTVERDGESQSISVVYAGSTIAALADAALGIPVVIHDVTDGMSAKEAGVLPGDVLQAVAGEPVRSTDHFRALVRGLAAKNEPFELKLWRFDAVAQSWQSVATQVEARWDPVLRRELIGVRMGSLRTGMQPPPGLGLGVESSPLADAGLMAGDAIVHIDADREQQSATIHVLRGGERVLIPFSEDEIRSLLRPFDPSLLMKFVVDPEAGVINQLNKSKIIALGQGKQGDQIAALAPFADVAAGERVERGVGLQRLPQALQARLMKELQPGDWVVGMASLADGTDAIEIIRGVTESPLQLTASAGDPGVAFAFDIEQLPYELEHWYDAFGLAADSGWHILSTTFQVVGAFFKDKEQGGVDPSRSLHGPVGIFSALKKSAESGFASFAKFVALLGMNLVIINLLPLPIADGGRLVILGIEVVMRRPLPERIVNAVMMVGVVMVIMLMLYVLALDISREVN